MKMLCYRSSTPVNHFGCKIWWNILYVESRHWGSSSYSFKLDAVSPARRSRFQILWYYNSGVVSVTKEFQGVMIECDYSALSIFDKELKKAWAPNIDWDSDFTSSLKSCYTRYTRYIHHTYHPHYTHHIHYTPLYTYCTDIMHTLHCIHNTYCILPNIEISCQYCMAVDGTGPRTQQKSELLHPVNMFSSDNCSCSMCAPSGPCILLTPPWSTVSPEGVQFGAQDSPRSGLVSLLSRMKVETTYHDGIPSNLVFICTVLENNAVQSPSRRHRLHQ